MIEPDRKLVQRINDKINSATRLAQSQFPHDAGKAAKFAADMMHATLPEELTSEARVHAMATETLKAEAATPAKLNAQCLLG